MPDGAQIAAMLHPARLQQQWIYTKERMAKILLQKPKSADDIDKYFDAKEV